MQINANHTKVGKLFGNDRVFRVPKYQRHYAWQTDEISDFKNDLKRCLDVREADPGKPRTHFFGGLVSIRREVPGSSRQEFEVVDGQQRLATFALLVSQLRRAMLTVAATFEKDDPSSKESFLHTRVKMLEARFQNLEDSVGLDVVDVPRLTLSGPDNEFFIQLLAGSNPESPRESHKFLKQAYDDLGKFLNDLVKDQVPIDAATRLTAVASVLEDDWTVLHMETSTQSEAYTLFQVLNDRGRSLTEGELMRAKTLELLDAHGSTAQKSQVEGAWDEMLSDKADRIEDNLRWIYASHSGKRPGKAQLFDDLMREFFPSAEKAVQAPAHAKEVVLSVKTLEKEIALSNRLLAGDWPYDALDPSVNAWEKDRLRLLTGALEHTNCIPLLIAATKLDQKQFSQVVQLLERFVFRYKLIVQAHISPATNLYHKQALAIRADSKGYKVSSLAAALKDLVNKHAGDGKFISQFESTEYASSANNRKIKYALLTLEHYRAWYDNGAHGTPTPSKNLVYDFINSTLEHIYPLKGLKPVQAMDLVANNIGNLAMLGPTENDDAGNKQFAEKKTLYKSSDYKLTAELAQHQVWDKAAIEHRAGELTKMALKVFSF